MISVGTWSAMMLAALICSFVPGAQDSKGKAEQDKPARTAAPRGKLSQAELEKRFAKTLTGATLKGSCRSQYYPICWDI